LILDALGKIDGIQCSAPKGAFYAFADFSRFTGNEFSDIELSMKLLEENKVACVPGSVFEGSGHLRLTYALDRESIIEGVRRIAEGLKSLE
jgi:aspartate aminotransferase